MKKTKILTLITSVALLALASCKPIDDPQQLTKGVVVTTTEPTRVSGTTAVCGAEVTADDAGLLLELGVCWSQSENPTIDDQTSKTFKCSQPYQCFLMDLEPNTKYHVRGFAKYGTEYCYGDEKTFTTLNSDAPAHSPVTTHEAINITSQSFRTIATIEYLDPFSLRVGACYSTDPEFTIEDCNGYELAYYDYNYNRYIVDIYHLAPNTTYYFRAFAVYGDLSNPNANYFYGDILSFTTLEIPFMLDLYTQYANYHNYNDNNPFIYTYGYGECNRTELIDQVGFCYSTTNAYPQYESDLHTTCATPTGEWFDFESNIYNLSSNTKYYIRAYARYKTDSIKYGNVVSIDTY